ncbi:alpha/beta fold hydrolase [Rhodococcus fascians]|nr:alpha/beta fold hydrolase [Rhodococcus fascians]MBY3824225.1 alpha/beta fold hydrolase [Rhodococcus fascians]MBY3834747.1 alpha/beta fold hydrolase [Rhodococcus fascians]MBY3863959.1 alpha/beta fold hydrolase [Rhodococcus fascians]MBY3883430.1 alpha/beta fold hydrolase [Rhodococcus fascians]
MGTKSQLGKKSRRTQEWGELGELTLRELASAAGGVRAVHSAIARRAFSAVRRGVGPAVLPTQVVHDAIAAGTYASIAAACTGAAKAVGALTGGDSDLDDDPRPLPSHTARGAQTIAVLHGLIGDDMERTARVLAYPMSIRVDGRPVPPKYRALAAGFPTAGAHLVVFLHGLVETESAWRLGGRPTYGERLDAEAATTSIFLRYNTGRRISANGAELSDLLEELVTAWPVRVHRITLVGHSMGGLVSRSAAHQAAESGRRWVDLLTDVFTLGTPHLGAPLAHGVHLAAAAMALAPETRPFANLLARRSAGIRDLIHGSITAEDGHARYTDSFDVGAAMDVSVPDRVRHHHASAIVTGSPRNPFGMFIGDGLVRTDSAGGRNKLRNIGLRPDDGLAIYSAHHFTLLNDERVYGWMRGILVGDAAQLGSAF